MIGPKGNAQSNLCHTAVCCKTTTTNNKNNINNGNNKELFTRQKYL